MLALGSTALGATSLAAVPSAQAQAQPERGSSVLLVVDGVGDRLHPDALTRALARALRRPVLRMTDERASSAEGRLTVAYSAPNHWVLRYEARGQVAWLTDRIIRGSLTSRLTELTAHLISRVEAASTTAPAPATRGRGWDDEMVLALANEIVDPFGGDGRVPARTASLVWSEVVDPFAGRPSRVTVGEVSSEVLDPWSAEIRRR
jgi:hypothetical protein